MPVDRVNLGVLPFVVPFINLLGYDVFNPTEVVPEFTADVGTKAGEKVDYAIFKDDEVVMLIECKKYGEDLSDVHTSQLYQNLPFCIPAF